MNASEFVSNYNMHDSLIDQVLVNADNANIDIWIDFAFWMQKNYLDTDPETGTLKVTFSNVSAYTIPNDVDWNAISILGTRIDEGNIIFSLINDMTDDCLEISICSNDIAALPIMSH